MSTDAIAVPRTELASPPIVARLHDWVTTVDHKRLGILYIIYALVFLLIAGVEAIIIRIQLIRPHNDFLHGDACSVWIRKLFDPTHDWCAGHGFSAPECFQLLDDRFRRTASLL